MQLYIYILLARVIKLDVAYDYNITVYVCEQTLRDTTKYKAARACGGIDMLWVWAL